MKGKIAQIRGGSAMAQGIERPAFYFKKKGPSNTDKTLEIALSFCKEQGIRTRIKAVLCMPG